MSEPSSLYMRVTLSENNLNAFKQSQLTAPRQYNDWRLWLESRKFYGQITYHDIQSMQPPDAAQQASIAAMFASALGQQTPAIPAADHALSVEEYLSLTLGSVFWAPSRSNYDAASNTWTLCIPQFSENYGDFIRELAILRAIERYKDLPGDDFILIWPHFWGGDAQAYLVIEQGTSRLLTDASDSAVNEAILYLNQLMREAYPDMDTPG